MESNLIKKIGLENGLDLKFYDASKKVAGDRWMVKLVAKIEIPVREYLNDADEHINAVDAEKTLGPKIIFEKAMERNFIDNKEKEKVLNGFCDSFLKSTLSYLSAPNFPMKFIMKTYREKKDREKWYQR